MQSFKKSLVAATALALVASPALALPDDAAEMRELLASKYGGDPVAYVNDERNDFRRMGCRGETELVQTLLDAGLRLANVDRWPRNNFMHCAIWEDEHEVLALAIDPDAVAYWEDDAAGTRNWIPLQFAIRENNYEAVSLVLANGATRVHNSDGYLNLTREEHLLLAAHDALQRNKREAVRAFRDSGFGYFLDQAANDANVRYVETRAGGGSGGGGGGGLLGAIAGGVAGAYLGGSLGAGAGLLMGATENGEDGDGNAPKASGPLPLESSRAELGLAFDTIRSTPRGLQVKQVMADGPAAIAGMQRGDLIVGIAGEPVASRASFYLATAKALGMPEFEVEYLRNGQTAMAVFGRERPEVADAEFENGPAESAGSVTGPTTANSADVLGELERLGDLRDRGIISEEEFETLKGGILEGS